MFQWMALLALMCAEGVIIFLAGRYHPYDEIRAELIALGRRKEADALTKKLCNGGPWRCVYKDGPYRTYAKLIRTCDGKELILPDLSVPEGSSVIFTFVHRPENRKEMPYIFGLERWLKMEVSWTLPPVDDGIVDD